MLVKHERRLLVIFYLKIFSGNMLVRYRGKIIKVSWRDPGRNGRFWGPFLVLWNVSLPENVEKLTFRCHVRPNRLKICMYDRMPCAVILEPPNLPNFNLNCQKTSSYEKPVFWPSGHKIDMAKCFWGSIYFGSILKNENETLQPCGRRRHRGINWRVPGLATFREVCVRLVFHGFS